MSTPDDNLPPMIREGQMGMDPRAPLLDRESTVAKMFLELGTPTQAFGLDIAFFEDSLARVLEPWVQLLQRATKNSLDAEAVIAPFVRVQVLTRALTDLIAATYLASRGYLIQAYSDIKNASEGVLLLELFATQPEEASKWLHCDKPHQEFAPAAVRRKLERAGHDQTYARYCGRAHSRAEGIYLMGHMQDDVATIFIGPYNAAGRVRLPIAMSIIETALDLGEVARVALVPASRTIDESDWQEAWAQAQDAARQWLVRMNALDENVAFEGLEDQTFDLNQATADLRVRLV
jgi:hypothetical protein